MPAKAVNILKQGRLLAYKCRSCGQWIRVSPYAKGYTYDAVLKARPQFLCLPCRLKFYHALKEVKRRRERDEACYACPGCARIFTLEKDMPNFHARLYMFCEECRAAGKHNREVKIGGRRKKIRSIKESGERKSRGIIKKRDTCAVCGAPVPSSRRKFCSERCKEIFRRARQRVYKIAKAAEEFRYFVIWYCYNKRLTLDKMYEEWEKFRKSPLVILAKQLQSYLRNL